jgi:hypothetical protein
MSLQDTNNMAGSEGERGILVRQILELQREIAELHAQAEATSSYNTAIEAWQAFASLLSEHRLEVLVRPMGEQEEKPKGCL